MCKEIYVKLNDGGQVDPSHGALEEFADVGTTASAYDEVSCEEGTVEVFQDREHSPLFCRKSHCFDAKGSDGENDHQ